MRNLVVIALIVTLLTACNDEGKGGGEFGDTLRYDPSTGQPITLDSLDESGDSSHQNH